MESNYIVFDLEATCWDDFQQDQLQEIVEIGAYKIDEYGVCISSFHEFVCPTVHKHLSPYFKKLTGHSEKDIFIADPFKHVYTRFKQWILKEHDFYLLCAWGNRDLDFLNSNADLFGLEHFDRHLFVDIKRHYNTSIIRNHGKPYGLLKALHREGMEFEGKQHTALDDAFNLSKIFVKYIDEWQRYNVH